MADDAQTGRYLMMTAALKTSVPAIAIVIVGALLLQLPLPSAAADGDALGRLFTSPQERALLDKLRLAKPKPKVKRRQAQAAPQEDAPLRSFRFDGVVTRSGGASTAWVNGNKVYQQGSTRDGVALEVSPTEGELNVQLPRGGDSLEMKVGERFDPLSGRVKGPLQAPGK